MKLKVISEMDQGVKLYIVFNHSVNSGQFFYIYIWFGQPSNKPEYSEVHHNTTILTKWKGVSNLV